MKWLCTADSEETCHYLHQSKSSEHYNEVQPMVKRQLMLVVYYLYPTNPLWTDNYHFPGRSSGKKHKIAKRLNPKLPEITVWLRKSGWTFWWFSLTTKKKIGFLPGKKSWGNHQVGGIICHIHKLPSQIADWNRRFLVALWKPSFLGSMLSLGRVHMLAFINHESFDSWISFQSLTSCQHKKPASQITINTKSVPAPLPCRTSPFLAFESRAIRCSDNQGQCSRHQGSVMHLGEMLEMIFPWKSMEWNLVPLIGGIGS